MTTKAQTTKSNKGPSLKDKPTKQVDDPIIIKGGSISVQFDDDSKFKKDNGNPKNKFDHLDNGRELNQLVVFRRQSNGVYKEYRRLTLKKHDNIVICYTGSRCTLAAVDNQARLTRVPGDTQVVEHRSRD